MEEAIGRVGWNAVVGEEWGDDFAEPRVTERVVRERAERDRSSVPQDADQLRERAWTIRKEEECERAGHDVEGPVIEPERFRVHQLGSHVIEPGFCDRAVQDVKHLAAEVDPDHRTGGAHRARRGNETRTLSGRNVEDVVSFPDARRRDKPFAEESVKRNDLVVGGRHLVVHLGNARLHVLGHVHVPVWFALDESIALTSSTRSFHNCRTHNCRSVCSHAVARCSRHAGDRTGTRTRLRARGTPAARPVGVGRAPR